MFRIDRIRSVVPTDETFSPGRPRPVRRRVPPPTRTTPGSRSISHAVPAGLPRARPANQSRSCPTAGSASSSRSATGRGSSASCCRWGRAPPWSALRSGDPSGATPRPGSAPATRLRPESVLSRGIPCDRRSRRCDRRDARRRERMRGVNAEDTGAIPPHYAPAPGTVRSEPLPTTAVSSPDDGRLRNLIEWAVIIVVAVGFALLVRGFAFQTFYIPSDSMVPRLAGRRPCARQQARLRLAGSGPCRHRGLPDPAPFQHHRHGRPREAHRRAAGRDDPRPRRWHPDRWRAAGRALPRPRSAVQDVRPDQGAGELVLHARRQSSLLQRLHRVGSRETRPLRRPGLRHDLAT